MATRTIQLLLPIDPTLPERFDDTPNEARSKVELDQWWDKPYLLTNPDGTYTARCLNGAASYRSTVLAHGSTVDEATERGLAKHALWLERRSRPIAYVQGTRCDVVIEPQRPDEGLTYLARDLSFDDASAFIKQYLAGGCAPGGVVAAPPGVTD
ncbi:hypothetical protein [Xanthomonas sacchari]|uniref:hypothetical protein n=1 Tax=Xanthomonas sacchari TaxID=56458 RepID=UPI00225DD6D0|nr:hypothetical protein [Xanthomonas sacchari]